MWYGRSSGDRGGNCSGVARGHRGDDWLCVRVDASPSPSRERCSVSCRGAFPPATVYMGDSGTVLIGLVMGRAVAIPASLGACHGRALDAPLAILHPADARHDRGGRPAETDGPGFGDRRSWPSASRLDAAERSDGSACTCDRRRPGSYRRGCVAAFAPALKDDLFRRADRGRWRRRSALIAGKLLGNAELRLIHKRLAAALRGSLGRGEPDVSPVGTRNPTPGQRRLGPGVGRPDGDSRQPQLPDDLPSTSTRRNHENYHAPLRDRPGRPAGLLVQHLEIPLFIDGVLRWSPFGLPAERR